MRTFIFDKLVRDKIPEDMRQEGSDITIRQLDDEAYLQALKDKILEEAGEINLQDRSECLAEIADLQEVMDCMIEALHASRADVQEIQTAKCLKRGSFKQREYIEKISINDDMPMVEHYLANPDRYPEVV